MCLFPLESTQQQHRSLHLEPGMNISWSTEYLRTWFYWKYYHRQHYIEIQSTASSNRESFPGTIKMLLLLVESGAIFCILQVKPSQMQSLLTYDLTKKIHSFSMPYLNSFIVRQWSSPRWTLAFELLMHCAAGFWWADSMTIPLNFDHDLIKIPKFSHFIHWRCSLC